MTFERYNRILGAVLGTLTLLGIVAASISALVISDSRRGDARVLLKRGAEQPTSSVVYFCRPITVSGTAFQLLPLAAINPRNSNDPVIDLVAEISVKSSVDRRFQQCGYGGGFDKGRVFDAILRDVGTGKQSLLWSRPALLESFDQGSSECDDGRGRVPCQMHQWLAHDADTNRNGAIDREDALGAFELTSAGVLKRITPPDSSILEWTWDRDHNTLLYTVARDTNGDRRFTPGDQTDVLQYTPGSGGTASSIVDRGVLAQLLQRSK